ncbi:cob(I)yrinic acid a,c-diamide adenosyltransferase [Candidatus Merdisoma sp. HCP28S3_D10]|uniref:cob(I)yrinic acid a,c-diamide adenosyltransferase n=1 Tax=unclassified Candidatus Merdisoma TaxID=3099611 RepID=UPI003F8A57B7
MGKAHVTVFCGEGKGKTSAALGQGIFGASAGKSVIIIQFLKGKVGERIDFIKRLEPEIKVFCFEKSDLSFEELSPEEQQEEIMNIRNGMNFARKVLTTDGCDILILDEVLGLVDKGIISIEEMKALLEAGDGDTELVLTGIKMFDELYPYADDVFCINTRK